MRRRTPLIVLLAVAAGCGFDWDRLDPRAEATATTTTASSSGAGGMGGVAATGGHDVGGAATGGGGAGATGGHGGAGGMPTLVSDDALAQFFFDEAAQGQEPTAVVDAIDGLSLPVTYEASDPSFVDGSNGRGLRWTSLITTGIASAPVGSGRLRMGLNGAQQLTLETVVELETVPTEQARIMQLSAATAVSGKVSLQIEPNTGRVGVDFNDTMGGVDYQAVFAQSLLGAGRVVLHVVFDTTQATDEDRVALFIDGVRIAPGAPMTIPVFPITLNDVLVVGTGQVLAIGGRVAPGPRPFPGIISYFAIHQVALSPDTIVNNAMALKADDDP